MPRQLSQREFALEVLTRLRKQGYQAYWAGGCVRDQLLGREPKDYDVATDATPPEILELFRHRRTLSIGAAFGVVAVVGPRSAGTVEVATFRRDADYSDGRHPDAVAFSTAEEDARRRDFTINGLFFDPLEDRVLDFVGGVEDLRRGVVRAIGDPQQRFREDKLRLLRAVRMAAVFEFALDEATLQAMRAMAAKVTVVSAERIAQEMRLLLTDAHRVRAVELLAESGLCQALLPEVYALRTQPRGEAATGGETWWDYTLRVLGALADADFALALAALLHRTAGGAHDEAVRVVHGVARRWRLSHDEDAATAWLVRHHSALDDAPHLAWSRLQPLLVARWGASLVELHAARAKADGLPAPHVEYCRQRLALPEAELNPPPLLSGHDLIGHGVPQGKTYSWLLSRVRDAQLNGVVGSREEALALVDRLLEEPGV